LPSLTAGISVLVTSFGCGDSRPAVPPPLLEKIRAALDEKDKAEDVLIQSGLTYTILRPGGLASELATGRGVLTEAIDVLGGINRADVAIAIGECLAHSAAANRVFGVFDRDQVRVGNLSEVLLDD
jgi:uncharacterized protein YbjT (DUF2867 family)